MTRIFLKLLHEVVRRRPKHGVDLMDLIKLVIPGEEREKRDHFEKDATYTPKIHFVAVVSIG
jgi:hypothetical protein